MAKKLHRSSTPVGSATAAIAATPPAADAAATRTECLSLSAIAHDRSTDLQVTLQAYLALERLVSPAYADEAHDNVPASRNQLGTLLQLLNARIQQQITSLTNTTKALQARLAAGEAAAS